MNNQQEHLQMHREDSESRSEHAAWMADIQHWRIQHKEALAALVRAQGMLLTSDAALEAHRAQIQSHEAHIHFHEDEMAQHEKGGAGARHDALAADHAKLQSQHDQARAAHEAMAHHHRECFVSVKELIEKLHASAGES